CPTTSCRAARSAANNITPVLRCRSGARAMFLAHRPSTRELQKFTEDSRALPLSYSQIGMAQDEPRSFDIDETTEPIGRGNADFGRAKAALAGWKHFEFDWVEVFPRNA